MKTRAILFFAAVIVVFACNNNSSENKTGENEKNTDAVIHRKYQVKSATITYEMTMKAGGVDITGKSIVYFDDYGMKERKDTYDENGNLKETFFSDGKTLYTLIHKDKSAFKRGDAYRGTEFKFDWNEMPSKDKETGKAKKADNETILGRDCEVFYHETEHGKARYAGWKNICLLMDIEGSGVSNKLIAVDIKEEPVSAETFTVPADYTLQ